MTPFDAGPAAIRYRREEIVAFIELSVTAGGTEATKQALRAVKS